MITIMMKEIELMIMLISYLLQSNKMIDMNEI